MVLSYLIRNILSNYVLVGVTGLAGFVLTPLLFHRLQPDNYAILIFALSLVAVMESLRLGLGSTLIRFVSELAAREQYTDLRRLSSTLFYFLAGLGILAFLLLALLSQPLASFFRVTGSPEAPGNLAITLAGLSLVFQFPSVAIRSFLEGCQDFHLANAVDILVQVIRAGLIVTLLLAGFGLLAIAAVVPTTALMRLAGMLLAARRATIPFRPSIQEVNLLSLVQTHQFAFLAFLLETLMQWFLQLDKFLAARLLPLPNLAILAVARRFPGALIDVSVQPLNVTYPLISSASARNDQRMIQKFLFLSTRNLLALTLPLALALFVWADVILRLWIGEEALVGVPVFRVFVIFAIFAILHDVPVTLLYGVGRIQFSAALSGALLIAGAVVGAWACSQYGLLGLAAAYTIVQGVGTVLLYRYALPLTQVNIRQWLRKAVAPPLWAAVPAIAWLAFSYWLMPKNLAGLVISVVPSFLLFFGSFVRLVVGPEKLNWRIYIRKLLTEID